MIRLPLPPVMRHDVCRDSIGPGVDANGARGTTRGSAGPSAARRGPAATAAAAARGRSAGSEALPGLESCQGAPLLGWQQAFFLPVYNSLVRPPRLFPCGTIGPAITTRVPVLAPLSRLPQAMAGVRHSVERDLGTRLSPVVGVGEAQPRGPHAAFPQEKFLGVRAASAGTPRVLAATPEAVASMRGTRP
jgi:hypothetical protein